MNYNYEFENGKTLDTVVKGDIITRNEKDYYDGKEYTLIYMVIRNNQNTVSVKCIDGYMKNSCCKIIK